LLLFLSHYYSFVIMERESNTDSYNGEVEDISLDESGSNAPVSEVEIKDSDSDISADIQA
jgi:hypothetical protein